LSAVGTPPDIDRCASSYSQMAADNL